MSASSPRARCARSAARTSRPRSWPKPGAAAARAGLHRFACVQNEYSLLHREPEQAVLAACASSTWPSCPSSRWPGPAQRQVPRGPAGARGTRLGAPRSSARTLWSAAGAGRAACHLRRARGHSLLELALGWLAGHARIASVIAGAMSAEQVTGNVAATTAWSSAPRSSPRSIVLPLPARPSQGRQARGSQPESGADSAGCRRSAPRQVVGGSVVCGGFLGSTGLQDLSPRDTSGANFRPDRRQRSCYDRPARATGRESTSVKSRQSSCCNKLALAVPSPTTTPAREQTTSEASQNMAGPSARRQARAAARPTLVGFVRAPGFRTR